MSQAQENGSQNARIVRRRKVFYIPGYDPIHPRRYRELYRKEGAAQSGISGFELSLSAKQGGGRYGWHVNARIEGASVRTDFEVLVWSDIVRDSMSNSIPATYLQLVRTAWTYIATGTLWRLMRLRKGPVIAALYPVVFLLVQLALALLIGAVAGQVLTSVVHGQTDRFFSPQGGTFAGALVFVVAAILSAWAVLLWFRARDNRFFAYYLMHDYAHAAALKGAYPPEIQARIGEFRAAIAEALRGDVDEVLVVGHSSGAYVGVSVLADLLEHEALAPGGPALGFLSLGQVIPMVSFLPRAARLRGDLRNLSAQDRLAWVDITAPGDGCAFALCDPVTVSGVAPPAKRWPLVISAAFTQTLSPARWKALRWRFFRLHFQYLCAFDRPGDYDYFRVTAGPRTLRDRYAGRAPSRSRIEKAVSKYTSTRAA